MSETAELLALSKEELARRVSYLESIVERYEKERRDNDGELILRDTVKSSVEDIIDEIKRGIITGYDGICEAVYADADNACTYYSDCWAICKDWNGDKDNLDSGLWKGADGIDGMITGIAYAIVEQEIWDGLRSKLESEFGTDDYDKVFSMFFTCDSCWETAIAGEDDEAKIETADGDEICRKCFEEKFDTCDKCGKVFPKDRLTDGRCEDCREEE